MKVLLLALAVFSSNIAIAETVPPKDQWLEAHNEARALKNVPPLKWDKRLVKAARNHLRELKANCKMYHSKNGYGENLAAYWGFGGKPRPIASSVQAWLNEEKYYKPGKPDWCEGGECRHYTQVLWSESKFLGCAQVKCMRQERQKDGKIKEVPMTIRSCNYDPPGNWRGKQPY